MASADAEVVVECIDVSGSNLDVAGSSLPERSGGLGSISFAFVCLVGVPPDPFEGTGLVLGVE